MSGRWPSILGRVALWLLILGGLAATIVRFGWGLGAVSNLRDDFPWGLWVGVDVLGGVALAAGGFTITCMVYILDIRELKPLVRPVLLTAFIGYLLVSLGLLFDLGKPWNIWHAIIFWNPRSVMFEVAWCVMLYTTVLALEFSEPLLERLRWTRLLRIRRSLTVLLVGAGVILSTLHQSSLGSVFLIAQGRLHDLWYSPQLPVLFFASAVMVAFAVVLVESALSKRYLGHGLPPKLTVHVGFFLLVTTLLYLLIRLLDLVSRGALPLVIEGSVEAGFFIAEVGLLAVAAGLLWHPRIRTNPTVVAYAGVLVVVGVLLHRFNVSIVGFFGVGGIYWPAWTEVLITLFLAALGVLAFGQAAKRLPVFTSTTTSPAAIPESAAGPQEVTS